MKQWRSLWANLFKALITRSQVSDKSFMLNFRWETEHSMTVPTFTLIVPICIKKWSNLTLTNQLTKNEKKKQSQSSDIWAFVIIKVRRRVYVSRKCKAFINSVLIGARIEGVSYRDSDMEKPDKKKVLQRISCLSEFVKHLQLFVHVSKVYCFKIF